MTEPMPIETALFELQTDWRIQITSIDKDRWQVQLVPLTPGRSTFIYRGTNLRRLVMRAWAGEPPEEKF